MTTISVPKLITEIEKAAVEKQSDLLNKVKLIKAKHECDEPIRTYVARLRVDKYDSLNKIQTSGYLVDLFRLWDSPRKDYQIGLVGYKML
jgi:hypothetical protein